MACKEGSSRTNGCNGCYASDVAREDIPYTGGCFDFTESGGYADELADYLFNDVRPALADTLGKNGISVNVHKRVTLVGVSAGGIFSCYQVFRNTIGTKTF